MSDHQPVEPICVRVNDAARMIGVGRTKLYELISCDELETVKSARQRASRQPVCIGWLSGIGH